MTRRRAPKRPANERKRLILESAESVFASSSYAKAGAADVAKAAGVSAPALYRYFRSKKDLYIATLKAAEERLLGIWARTMCRSEDALDAIWSVGAGYYDHAESRSPVMKMWFHALSESDDPEVRDALGKNFTAFVDLLEDTLKRGRDRGSIRKDIDLRLMAWQFMTIGLTFDLIHVLGLDEEELQPRKVAKWAKLYMESVKERADAAP